jgi:type I restriction enzyme S subunit
MDFQKLNGILSPLFFTSTPNNTKGFIELNKLAEINPYRRIDNLSLDTKVPYVGLPETANMEVKTVLERPYKEVKGRNIIKKGDILFARIEPSIFNKKYIFVDNLKGYDYAFTSTEFYIVRAKKDVNPKYLFYMFFMTDVFSQVLGRTTGSTGRRRLDKGVFENLLIPSFIPSVQNKIAKLMQTAYDNKKQKEEKAENLLNSIDDFVLEQLGIELPEVEVKKCFTVQIDELEKRLDPLYYSQELLNFIKHSKNKIMTIAEISDYIKSGFAAGKSDQDETSNGIIQIRPTNINDDRQLIFDKNIYIKQEDKNEKKSYLLNKREILFNNTNSQELVGKTVLFDLDGDYFCSNHITRIKVKEDIVNANYLALILNLYQRNKVFFNTCTNWNNQSGVNGELLGSFIIPVPDMDIQIKIATEIQNRTAQAKQLQQEATAELEEAKARVEKIILGEEI